MNMQKDMEKFQEIGYEGLMAEIKSKEYELAVKKHLLKVFNIINKIEKLYKEGDFDKVGASYIILRQSSDYDAGEIFTDLELLDKDKKRLSQYASDGQYTKAYSGVADLLGEDNLTLDIGLCNSKTREANITLEVGDTIKKQLRGLLLSENIRGIYEDMESYTKTAQSLATVKKAKKM